MEPNSVFSDYWELLNNCEDYINGGYRSTHEAAPEFQFISPHPESVINHSDEKTEPFEPRESDRKKSTEINGEERILSCRDCDLHLARAGAIPGRGSRQPRIMVILPPPGYNEDDHSVPISGEREDFLNKWIKAIGLTADQIYVTNTVKCRTPGTRPPLAGELMSCRVRLQEQIDQFKPSALLILGETAFSSFSDILPPEQPGSQLMNKYHGRPFNVGNVFFLATYDPGDVLEKPELKRTVWEDLKILRDFLAHG